MGIVFLEFLWPFWLIGEYGASVASDRQFRDPDRCGYCGFCLKCVSKYWYLTLRNGDGLGGGLKGCTGWRKAKYSTRICLVSWQWEQSKEEITGSLLKTSNKNWGLNLEESMKSEHLMLGTLFASLEGVATVGSRC